MGHTCMSAGEKIASVTVGMGVTNLDQVQGHGKPPKVQLELLIKQADDAIHASKNAGRNRVTLLTHTALINKT